MMAGLVVSVHLANSHTQAGVIFLSTLHARTDMGRVNDVVSPFSDASMTRTILRKLSNLLLERSSMLAGPLNYARIVSLTQRWRKPL